VRARRTVATTISGNGATLDIAFVNQPSYFYKIFQ
jgi:hypothetical protein